MDFIYSAMSIWMLVVWIIGAITITGLFILALMWTCNKVCGAWGKKATKHISTSIWVWQATRAWTKAGNPPPNNQEMLDEQEKIERCLRQVLVLAMEHGYVITVENKPRTPLAMGNSMMVYDVRESRDRYQKGDN